MSNELKNVLFSFLMGLLVGCFLGAVMSKTPHNADLESKCRLAGGTYGDGTCTIDDSQIK